MESRHHRDHRAPATSSAARQPTSAQPSNNTPIATVDGVPISRDRVVELLLRGHGPVLLEQLIVLEAAHQLASQRGLEITSRDVDREYERSLRLLTDPLAQFSGQHFDLKSAEQTLEAVLSERNVSHEEYMLAMRRNALLRKLVEADLTITDQQRHEEFAKCYGEQVQVRHIQLPTAAAAAQVVMRLQNGEDFAELARTTSANTASAARGGLLDPFAAADERVPAALRDAAFQLEVGQTSNAVRVGVWYHILHVERRSSAQSINYQDVLSELEQSLRHRLAEPEMQRLHQRLFNQARVRIHDPALKESFERNHPAHP